MEKEAVEVQGGKMETLLKAERKWLEVPQSQTANLAIGRNIDTQHCFPSKQPGVKQPAQTLRGQR